MRRPLVILLFATIFVAELGWSGVSPLLPTYRDLYGLSDAATGLILSLSAVGILLVSLPAGALSRRFALRTLTIWGTVALSTGNLLVGLSHTYALLLAGRALFGMGLGMMWVTGTAWLHAAAGDRAPQALAATTAVVGAGSLVSPSITGALAEHISLGTPFVMLGILSALMTVILLLAPGATGREREPGPPLREMLRAAGADHTMLVAVTLTLAVSMMWMTAELLVPLRLDAHGFSASRIGIAFSATSVVFIATSAITARRADRYATMRIASFWTFLLGLGVVIAAVGVSVPATLVFLIVAGVTSGVMIALTYPLGVVGAQERGYSVAVVGALLNMVWAGAGIIGPIASGAMAGSIDDRVAFGALAALAIAASVWMWVRRDRASRPPVQGLRPAGTPT
jgi:MFS family permease